MFIDMNTNEIINYKKFKNLINKNITNNGALLFNSGKEISWVLIGQVISFIGKIIGIKLITNYLNADLYGKFSLGLSIASFISQSTGGFAQATLRYFNDYREKGEVSKQIFVLIKILSIISSIMIAFTVVIVLILNVLNYDKWNIIVVISLLIGILGVGNEIIGRVYDSIRKRFLSSVNIVFRSWIPYLVTIFLINFIKVSDVVALGGYLLGTLLVFISQSVVFVKTFRNEVENGFIYSRDIFERYINYALPFLYWGIPSWFQSYGDRWIINGLLDTRSVGLYAILVQIGGAPIIFLRKVRGEHEN